MQINNYQTFTDYILYFDISYALGCSSQSIYYSSCILVLVSTYNSLSLKLKEAC